MKRPLYCCLPVLLPTLCLANVTEINQQPTHTLKPLVGQNRATGPDESILWSLFHAGKIDALKYHINDLRQRFSSWQVPFDLQNALNQANRETLVAAKPKRKKKHAAKLTADACSTIDKKWASAQTQWAKGQRLAAIKRYARIIDSCKNPDLVRASLEKAINVTDHADYFNLTALAVDVLPETELQGLEYQWLKNDYLHQAASSNEPVDNSTLQFLVERYQDVDMAIMIGWDYFNRQQYRKADAWFSKTSQWKPASHEAMLGKLLSLEKLEDYDEALAFYLSSKNDEKLDELAGRLYKIKAWQAIKATQPQQAEQHMTKARALVNGADLELNAIEAWIADSQQQYAKAATLFETLYRQSPSIDYASAYVRNQSQVDSDRLASMVEQSDVALRDEYRLYLGSERYNRKQLLTAQNTAPSLFPKLTHIDTPTADWGVYARHKEGGPGPEQGFNALDILKMPVGGGSYTLGGIHQFKLNLSRVELRSGIASSADTGITNTLTDGLETEFSYRMDGWFSPYLRLGNTPTAAVITPTVTFDAGFVQQTKTGNAGLNVYSQPVRQSILSYTGIRTQNFQQVMRQFGLPSTLDGFEWGRVLRSGIKAAGFHRFNKEWGLAASAEVAMLNGQHVADNNAIAVTLDPSFTIPIAGFDYFSVGPSLAYEHFDRNLSHFMPGHGGYFSPEHYFTVGPSLQLLSEEGKPLLFKAHVMAGVQVIKQADAPILPLMAPDIGKFQDNKGYNLSDALDIELKGVWLLTPHLQLGVGGAVRHTANYEDYSGGLSVRLLFQERKASYSSDIPDAMFNSIQRY